MKRKSYAPDERKTCRPPIRDRQENRPTFRFPEYTLFSMDVYTETIPPRRIDL